jgi:hypothetical protein
MYTGIAIGVPNMTSRPRPISTPGTKGKEINMA